MSFVSLWYGDITSGFTGHSARTHLFRHPCLTNCVKNGNSHIYDEITRRLLSIISHNVLNNRLFQKIRSSSGPN